jgi:hypothetical protein
MFSKEQKSRCDNRVKITLLWQWKMFSAISYIPGSGLKREGLAVNPNIKFSPKRFACNYKILADKESVTKTFLNVSTPFSFKIN